MASPFPRGEMGPCGGVVQARAGARLRPAVHARLSAPPYGHTCHGARLRPAPVRPEQRPFFAPCRGAVDRSQNRPASVDRSTCSASRKRAGRSAVGGPLSVSCPFHDWNRHETDMKQYSRPCCVYPESLSTHTSFSPHPPERCGLLLDDDLGHLVRAVLQVITSASRRQLAVRAWYQRPPRDEKRAKACACSWSSAPTCSCAT